jgi:hypothetical protein
MKRFISFISLIFFLSSAGCQGVEPDDFPVLEGPYLGQKPPGDMNILLFSHPTGTSSSSDCWTLHIVSPWS